MSFDEETIEDLRQRLEDAEAATEQWRIAYEGARRDRWDAEDHLREQAAMLQELFAICNCALARDSLFGFKARLREIIKQYEEERDAGAG